MGAIRLLVIFSGEPFRSGAGAEGSNLDVGLYSWPFSEAVSSAVTDESYTLGLIAFEDERCVVRL